MRKGSPADRGPLKQREKGKAKALENKDDEEQDNLFVSHLIVLPSPASPLATDLQAPPNPPLDDDSETFHEEVEKERPQQKNEENNQLVKQILRVMKPKVGNQTPPRLSPSPSATYYSPSKRSAPGSPSETHSFQRTFRRGRSFDESQRNKDMWGRQGFYEGLRCVIDSSRMRVLLEEQVGTNFVRLRRGRKSVGLGSSDMADVCGHGRGLPLHFWEQILIQKELRESGHEIPDTGNPMTRHGHRFERVAKRVYEIISGNVCYAGGVWRILLEESALWVSCSPTDSWDLLGCSPDSCVLFDSPPVPADLLLLLPPTSSHSLSSLIIDHFQDHPLLSSIQQTLSFNKHPSISVENSQPTQPRHPQDPTKSPSSQTRKSSSSPLIKTSQMVLRDRTHPGGFHRLKNGVEFKCPVFRMYDKVPKKYVTQMQYQAWAMRVPYIDFCAVLIRPRSVAFSTREPDTCNYDSLSDSDFVVEEIMVARMYRNERFISWMMPLVRTFSSCLWHKERPSWGWKAVPSEVKCRIEVLIKGRVDQEVPSEIRCPSTFTDAWTHLPDLNALLLRWNILRSLAPILPVISSSESPSW